MSQSSPEQRIDMRIWLPVNSATSDRPHVSKDEVENEFEIPLLFIYYTSRTFIVLCTIFIVFLGAVYLTQMFYLIDMIPTEIGRAISKEYTKSKCDPNIDTSCASNINQCNVGIINTCVGGDQPKNFIVF